MLRIAEVKNLHTLVGSRPKFSNEQPGTLRSGIALAKVKMDRFSMVACLATIPPTSLLRNSRTSLLIRCTFLHSDAYARLTVAIDVANALCELHYNCQYPIFHRDVKSSNVLLDSDYHAKLSDLGIAVVIKQESDLQTLVALGAFGYKDPVCEQSGKLDDKTDVYSFGVLLMELATHLPAWDTKRPVTLLSHIVLERMQRGKIEKLIQPGTVVGGMALMKEVLQVAKQCCSLDLQKRPKMDQVAAFLVSLRSYFLQEQKRLAAQQEPEVNRKECLDAEVPQLPNRVFYRGKWVVPKGEIEAY